MHNHLKSNLVTGKQRAYSLSYVDEHRAEQRMTGFYYFLYKASVYYAIKYIHLLNSYVNSYCNIVNITERLLGYIDVLSILKILMGWFDEN